jgi:hypothetical protein
LNTVAATTPAIPSSSTKSGHRTDPPHRVLHRLSRCSSTQPESTD